MSVTGAGGASGAGRAGGESRTVDVRAEEREEMRLRAIDPARPGLDITRIGPDLVQHRYGALT